MAAASVVRPATRTTDGTGVLVALSIVHGVLLLAVPSAPLVAILLWWNANTVSHNFIHRPFFRSRTAIRGFAAYLTLLIGVPQSFWRARHLAHHAATSGRAIDVRRQVAGDPWAWAEAGLVVALWTTLAAVSPDVVLHVYLPGQAAGLALCWLQGYYEHAGGATSHYGRLYNTLFFNDGYHVEHHERPFACWNELARNARRDGRQSTWPPVLRWIDAVGLDSLERVVLRSVALQRFVLWRHERAFRELMSDLPPVARVTIVGGGLFPRTAMVLTRVLPSATLTVVDMRETHLRAAQRFLGAGVTLACGRYDPGQPEDADLVVIPLAFRGDRRRVYREPNAPAVFVHDWLWARHPRSACVSWLLLKRLNLVRR
jgi:Fatty acid desaturase